MTFLQFCTAWIYPILLAVAPLVFIRISKHALPHYARWSWSLFLHMAYVYTVIIGCGLPVLVIGATISYNTAAVSAMRIGPYHPPTGVGETAVSSLYADEQINAGGLHGLAGWEGVDVATSGADRTIYAPFSGTVELVGCDTYNAPTFLKVHPVCGTKATILIIKSDDGAWRTMLLHGDYTVAQGAAVKQGQPVGTENCWGWCTGNHTHITLWHNGAVVNYLDYRGTAVASGQASAESTSMWSRFLRSLLTDDIQGKPGDAPLRVSHYDPAAGGINCDSDCSTMASGEKVAAWVNGHDGTYAAACPAEWAFGTRFRLYGRTYECQDRGGWIKARHPGDYDPAMRSMATETYYWVDLLDTPPVPYGTLVYDWQFVD